MASKDAERNASVGSAPQYNLASEDDAADLGTEVHRQRAKIMIVSNLMRSQAWIQARATTQFHYDRGLRYRFQYNGPSAINRLDFGLLNPRRTCRNGLGMKAVKCNRIPHS